MEINEFNIVFFVTSCLFSLFLGYKKFIFPKDIFLIFLPFFIFYFSVIHFDAHLGGVLYLLFFLLIIIIFIKNLRSLTISLSLATILFAANFLTKFLTTEILLFISNTHFLLLFIISFILFSLILCFLKKMDVKYQLIETFLAIKLEYKLFNFFIVIVFLSFDIIQFFIIHFPWYQRYLVTWAFILIFTVIFIIFYFVVRFEKERRIVNSLLIEFQEQKSLIEGAHEFKHDYRGILLTLTSYIEQDKKEEALDFIKKITRYSDEELDGNMYSEISKITSFPIQGLLMKKCKFFKSKNVYVDIRVNTAITNTGINLFDLLRLINIVLDNAYEATEAAPEALISIEIKKIQNKLLVQVKNTTSQESIDLSKIIKKNYTTKANHSGKGLHIVDKICTKYHNISYQISHNNKFFTIVFAIEV